MTPQRLQEEKLTLQKVGEGEFSYQDNTGCHYNTPYEWLWTDILGGCGCGSSDDFGERAFKVLELFATPHLERQWNVYDKEADEIIAHWLDSKDLTEHGSSVNGSWLTAKGEEVYQSIKSLL